MPFFAYEYAYSALDLAAAASACDREIEHATKAMTVISDFIMIKI